MHRSSLVDAALALMAIALGACTGVMDETDDSATVDAIVSGARETGYTAVGYLRRADMGVMCNATLVAPRVALTAAHCVYDNRPAHDLRMGFGDVGTQPTIRVKRVIVHPRYTEAAGIAHDVAVLILERDGPVTPALLGSTAVGDDLRVIGYGRTFDAAFEDKRSYVHLRKSALVSVLSFDRSEVRTVGVTGGACRGDSGTGLFLDATNTLVAIHSRSPESDDYACGIGVEKLATTTEGESAFFRAALSCNDDSLLTCGSTLDPACIFRCADYAASPGDNAARWICGEDQCLRMRGM